MYRGDRHQQVLFYFGIAAPYACAAAIRTGTFMRGRNCTDVGALEEAMGDDLRRDYAGLRYGALRIALGKRRRFRFLHGTPAYARAPTSVGWAGQTHAGTGVTMTTYMYRALSVLVFSFHSLHSHSIRSTHTTQNS